MQDSNECEMLKARKRNAHSCAARQYVRHAIVGLLALSICGAAWAAEYGVHSGASPVAERRAELVTLVRQDCGSCHGMTLKGGLGPALLPDALKDKPADYLKSIILYGRPDTAMPPWQRFLSEAEVEWIVFNLQKGFPGEH